MAEWDIFVNSKHILLNHKHTISLKCQRNLSLAVFFVVKWTLSAPGTDPFFRVCVCDATFRQVLESSHVLEVHLHSASASCSDEALDLASWTRMRAGEGWSWRGAHVWRGVVDYIGFPASGMIPENGSRTNIYSVADLTVIWFPSVDSSLVIWGSSSQLFSSFWIVCSFPRNKNNILPWNMWNSSHDSWLHPSLS